MVTVVAPHEIEMFIFRDIPVITAALCPKRTLYNNSSLFRALVIKRSYCWR